MENSAASSGPIVGRWPGLSVTVPGRDSSPGPAAAWMRTRRSEQDAVLAELSELDTGPPVRVVEHRAAEPVGLPALRSLADELYGDADPLAGGRRANHCGAMIRWQVEHAICPSQVPSSGRPA